MVAVLTASPAVAVKVEAFNGSNVYVTREASDSAEITVTVYRYSGNPTSYQLTNGSFCTTQPSTAFFYNQSPLLDVKIPASCNMVTYPLLPSYSYLFYFPATGGRWFVGAAVGSPVYFATANSAVPTEPTIARVRDVTTLGTVGVMPTLSVGSTLAIAGTQTVDPWSTAGMPEGWQVVLAAAALFLFGYALYLGVGSSVTR